MTVPFQFYKVTRTSLGSRARVLLLQIIGGGNEGGDDTAEEAEVVPDVEYVQPLGVFARPYLTERLEAMAQELGDEVVVTALVDKSGGGGGATAFTDVEEGETRIYGAKEGAARLRILAAGEIYLEPLAGQAVTVRHPTNGALIRITGAGQVDIRSESSQDIVLNQGTRKVIRTADPVNVGTLTATAGPYPVTFVFTPTDADGGAGAPVTGATATLTAVTANSGGADHVKG